MTQFNAQVCVWEQYHPSFKFLHYEAFVKDVEKFIFCLTEDTENLHCKGKLILFRKNGLWKKMWAFLFKGGGKNHISKYKFT